MNKYEINYGFGRADFYTATKPSETDMIEHEFMMCANVCFGIRKSISGFEIMDSWENVELPLPYRGHEATHFLSHNGDDILFDARYGDGKPWKLKGEWGSWCSCRKRGQPEKSCAVHQYDEEDL